MVARARKIPGPEAGDLTHDTSNAPKAPAGFASEQLLSTVERYERLQEEKDGIADDQKEILAEAKAIGLDPKIIRLCLRIRKMDKADREEQEALLDLYLRGIATAEEAALLQSIEEAE